MKNMFSILAKTLVCSVLMTLATIASAAQITAVRTFATGSAVNASAPDSITVSRDSVWISYANGADSTGVRGSSTVVQYDLRGNVRSKYVIAGSVDGLKIDPRTGLVWALQNQDGNSTLTVIDPVTGITPQATYAVKSSTRGYDDVVFTSNDVFLSYSNPTNPTDATIQRLVKGSNPIAVTTILTQGARGTNIATGQPNQLTAQNDPDSLKLTPSGDLQLTSGDDGQLIFVRNPGAANQAVSFLQLLDSTGKPVSRLDDAVFATAEAGTFYLSDTNNNRVLAIDVTDLSVGSLFASVGSLNELASVDLKTGKVSAFVPNLNGPHGLVFVPSNEEDGHEDQH
jgi:hypothetical protein